MKKVAGPKLMKQESYFIRNASLAAISWWYSSIPTTENYLSSFSDESVIDIAELLRNFENKVGNLIEVSYFRNIIFTALSVTC